ncbi:fused response regulator/phosphatase [Actinomadura flavalba]|uniref:fused response regulator/phosphatase n=1 Tax=Actinomadura flavalba TaxID=1120938 RepID=UPI000368E7DD|nr:fused response regulator/phosphatase [Actinomadura flavalba]
MSPLSTAARADLVTALVVDDNDTKRYIIGSWLRRAGHTVIEAASAAQTWERLAEHNVELVILDVRLPDMSGIEVCERIKTTAEYASLPVIHISATAIDSADRTHGLRQGADAYMTDPIDPEEFLATVQAVLRYYLARRRAERTAGRLAALTRATLEINSAGNLDRLAAATATGAAEIFGVRASSFIMSVDGRLRRTVCLDPALPPEPRGCPPDALEQLSRRFVPLGESTGSAVARVPYARLGEIVADPNTEQDAVFIMARTLPGRPPICIALEAGGLANEEDLNLLRQLAQTVALAVEALRSYAEEHTVALTLQRSLLPSLLPEVAGWTFAVRYEPASEQAEVGGDFYEIIDLDGTLLIAIGDVQGHSLHAATVMAELRHALRAFADEGHDAATILERLNSVMHRYHDDQSATVCLLTLDPRTGDLELAGAGHLPALFHHDDRAWYGKGGGILLGFPVSGVDVENTTVPPGGAVALYTDGLIEDRDVSLSDNLERLRQMPFGGDAEAYCDRVLGEFGHREDDVALIVLHRTAPP